MWECWQHAPFDLAKLVIAAVIGGAIGFEREAHGQAAGLRTNILVCVGSCLLMMLSLEMEEIHRHLSVDQSVVRLDPARIASYAIASMGFLGAGAIIQGKGTVRGLTTAAGLWLVTGIGLAIGAGYLIPALFATLVSLLILYGLRRIKALFAHDLHTILTLKYREVHTPLEEVQHTLAENQISVQFINYKFEPPAQTVTYRLRLLSKDDITWKDLVAAISKTEGLLEADWTEGEVP
jgi:putative Mg2+ transporter-C (MgtC) family protein